MAVNLKDMDRRMNGALEVLHTELAGLRGGRASPHLLEPIMVAAYDGEMPLNQVAAVNVPEPRLLSVTVWDQSIIRNVEKAIRESGLGLNPIVEGNVLRLPIPELNAERRRELVKIAGKYAEQARIAIRNVRRDGMEQLKRAEKNGDIGQDEMHRGQEEIQKITDTHIATVESELADKEAEILQV